ncbi:growth/differentiation factor 8-like [Limulus polyphemus]|uniref:Growth/differentiation factor 8-like n=1 Tax=Limulus polyphemus TaxID=6850 RepID=A0ABM1BH50_LIMPO|nr:growth/differentiation factor 8-like [Limulus polyphemus]
MSPLKGRVRLNLAWMIILCVRFSCESSSIKELGQVKFHSSRRNIQSKNFVNFSSDHHLERNLILTGSDDKTVFHRDVYANCSICIRREVERFEHLEAIKTKILEKLGLKQPLNVSKKITLPQIPPIHEIRNEIEYINRSESNTDEEQEWDDETLPEKVIAFAEITSEGKDIITDLDYFLSFKFSEKLRNGYVSSAHLWLFLHVNETITGETWISLYKVKKESNMATYIKYRTKRIHTVKPRRRWVKINVRGLVTEWIFNPELNHGVMVYCFNHKGDSIPYTRPNHDIHYQMPFIEIKTNRRLLQRARRSFSFNCSPGSKETRCCRHPLTVDFAEMKWDFIIVPLRYQAYYCGGDCPPAFLPEHLHTVLAQHAAVDKSVEPLSQCCSASSLSPITIIYRDEAKNNYLRVLVEDMIVNSCSCS